MANWSGVITNAGNELLSGWVAGKQLNYSGAAAGTAQVAEIALMAQTNVAGAKKTAGIVGAQKTADGYRIKVRVTAATSAYTLFQIGIFASLSDPNEEGGTSSTENGGTLLALFQHQTGIPIPSADDTPDFVYTFSGLIVCSNEGQWTITISPETLATVGEVSEAVSQAITEHDSSQTAHQDLREQIRNAAQNATKVIISSEPPTTGPVIWFCDGDYDPTPANLEATLILGDEGGEASVYVAVDGKDLPVTNADAEQNEDGDTVVTIR